MRTILALARKDLRILTRVKSGMFFTFVWPIIVAILFGVVFSSQGQAQRALRIAAVDEDNTETSRAFLAKLESSGDFAVDRASLPDAEAMVRRAQRAAYIVIAPGFGDASERMFYGAPRHITIGNDPARPAEASMIEGLLTKHAMGEFQTLFTAPQRSKKVVGDALQELGPGANVSSSAPLVRFLTELDAFLDTPPSASTTAADGGWQPLQVSRTPVARERIGPANGFEVTFPQGIMWGIIGCVMSFAMGLVSERVHGTFVRLQTAPITRMQILAGKALACFAVISLLQATLIAIGVLGFGLKPAFALLAVACASAAFGFVGFMMMVAGLGRTEQAAAGAGWAMLMPMTLLGGGMMPQFLMPDWMQTAGNLSPVKWAILGIEGAVWRGFTASEMIVPCAILLIFGVVCFAVGVRGLREV